MKDLVYMGQFDRLKPHLDSARQHLQGSIWYQDLSTLVKDHWVYFQAFQDESGAENISAIGKNYLFKALFLHEDTVPAGNKRCANLDELCPRCSMFGLTGLENENEREKLGLRGRFKSAALINERLVAEETFPGRVPLWRDGCIDETSVPLTRWTIEGEEVGRQVLLPIMGAPKPNKRDIRQGYYDANTGMLKGAKQFLHARMNYDIDLPALISWTDGQKNNGDMPYAHNLRNYAQVCREGLDFRGTLGAENCSVDEIAALFVLLERGIAEHGFKIGLAKSHGFGSVTSTISRVWIRSSKNFTWQTVEVGEGGAARELLKKATDIIPGLDKAVSDLKNSHNAVFSMEERDERKLCYPLPRKYWENYRNKFTVL